MVTAGLGVGGITLTTAGVRGARVITGATGGGGTALTGPGAGGGRAMATGGLVGGWAAHAANRANIETAAMKRMNTPARWEESALLTVVRQDALAALWMRSKLDSGRDASRANSVEALHRRYTRFSAAGFLPRKSLKLW